MTTDIDVLIGRILDGTYPEGELLPSVRQFSEEFDVSPLTAAKVFQELHKENFTLKQKGIGAEVFSGSRSDLLKRERSKFMEVKWPDVLERMQQLGINLENLKS